MVLPVIILGDSHVRYMSAANWHNLFLPRDVKICEVGGATAVGMRNPNAKTNAIAQFKDFLKKQSKDAIIVIHLGEVDCGYVIWYRADKYNETVEHQLDQSVAAYFEFVDDLLARGYKHIVITGATLPTITDDEQAGEVVKLRSAIKTTQRERTDLTLAYNNRLKEQATLRHLLYTEITEDVLDQTTGFVDHKFRNPNPEDHHMNVRLTAPIWADRLNACFETYDPLGAEVCTFNAKEDSFAKGLALHSRDILPYLKLAIKKDDQLVAKFLGETGEYAVISDAVLNGEPVSRKIRLIHKANWERLEPVQVEAVMNAVEQAPEKTGVLQKAKKVFGKKSKKKR